MKSCFGCARRSLARLMIAWCMMSVGAAALWADASTVNYNWTDENVPEGTTLMRENGGVLLRVANDTATSLTVRLATIHDPILSSNKSYRVTGRVKYEGVEGTAYLETLNYIPRIGTKQMDKFFSRTLGSTGDMAALSGSSDWRGFALPFYLNETAPTRIDLNLILPGKGTVYLRGFNLEMGRISASNWGAIWGIAGAVFGVFCAMCSAMAGKARARAFVMPAIAVVTAGCAVLFAYGLYLLVRGQPFFDWYSPTFLGGLGLLLLPMLFLRNRKLYEQAELRRISAKDMVAD